MDLRQNDNQAFGESILSSLRVIARNEAIQTKSERRRPVALTSRKPPQAADGNGTIKCLLFLSPWWERNQRIKAASIGPPRGCLNRLSLSFLLLDEKEPKNQGQNHRPSARPPKRLTFKSGSDFCKVKRKRPSLKVKRLVVPWATAPPRFGRARAPTPVGFWRSRPRCPLLSLPFLTTHPHPLPSLRTWSAISYTARGLPPRRRFASSRGTKRSRWTATETVIVPVHGIRW